MLRWCSIVIGVGAFVGTSRADTPPSADKPDRAGVEFFETKIRPLFSENCFQCHGAKKQQGSLRLDTPAAIRTGGDTGPLFVAGKPKESLLLRAVNHEGPKMPPKKKLKPEEIGALAEWVKIGAPLPANQPIAAGIDIEAAKKTYWAFQPVAKLSAPASDWGNNPVDRFIRARLDAKGLKPVEPADKRTLIRRATFDLTGLPPTPEDIAAFLADESREAFAKVVDRLLASSAYGERWGRHWLDVVRYADTAGDNSDYPIPQHYKYRNWVINAVDADKPYDQFVQEQLAGDLMPAKDDVDRRKKIIATGYLANAKRFGSYIDEGTPPYPWYLTYEDTIDNLGRTFLGMTINCCRCHDHKFDPFTNEDYYAFYGFFSSSRYPWPGIELDKVQRNLVPLVPQDVVEQSEKERREKLAALDAGVVRLECEKGCAEQALKDAEKLPKSEETSAEIAGLKKQIEDLTKKITAAKKERDTFAKKPVPYETAYAMAEGKTVGRKKVGNACVQIKGDPERLGKEVPRRFPTVLGGRTLSADAGGSGRLDLARWLTDPANPLAARVMINRIWHYHFGKGIVQTPSDFGKQGMPPTHPELLDFLAARFIDSGWSLKKMHRLIMLSATYQLSSRDDAANAAIDVDNDFLWRFRRHRLDAESIRDTILAVSGSLDRSMGDAHPFPDQTVWDFTQHKPFKAVYETNRRSVYLMTQRIQRHPFLALFDGADTNASTSRRTTSTTPLQALYLMNDPFVHEQSRKFAARLLAERPDDPARVERAYLLTFGRPATGEEQAAAKDYLAQVRDKLKAAGVPAGHETAKAWESFVRVLFMSNEFVYAN
jgi:mono/diheme cytochrome c family protein